ncbi:MAG: hypothetical protein KBF43_01525 [Dermatophilaceae bacterium]|jgi:hypothetical protein|nr:hypothetical protein [Actinomycetales bacterium]MBP8881115.1 hypothetical protein [Dermatophilaceae bacterium]MBP9917251.1 hypothetical protein [Dermatophilaceae bacterium]
MSGNANISADVEQLRVVLSSTATQLEGALNKVVAQLQPLTPLSGIGMFGPSHAGAWIEGVFRAAVTDVNAMSADAKKATTDLLGAVQAATDRIQRGEDVATTEFSRAAKVLAGRTVVVGANTITTPPSPTPDPGANP